MTEISVFRLRQYSGIIGLHYDYKSNDVSIKGEWSRNDIINICNKYLKICFNSNKPIINMIIGQQENLFYVNDNEQIVNETCIRISGEITSRLQNSSDDIVIFHLIELFTYLCMNLHQDSIRFSYVGNTHNKSYKIINNDKNSIYLLE